MSWLRRPIGSALLLLALGCGNDGNATGDGTEGASGSAGETGSDTGSDGCEPILSTANLDTGFEMCMDGSTRRRAAIECPGEQTSPMSPCTPTMCTSDADCTAQPNGYCAESHNLTGYCGCWYGCQTDSDCEAGSICECGGVVGACVPATCTTNADCGPGIGCIATWVGTANDCVVEAPHSYACQNPADECQGDTDCPDVGINSGKCLLDGDHRVCGTTCELPP